jgi:integrase
MDIESEYRITEWDDTSWACRHSEILAPALGRFLAPGTPAKLARVLAKCSYATLPIDARAIVMNLRITGEAQLVESIDTFVRDAVSVAAPHTAYAAKVLLRTAGAYVSWCVRDQGWPLDADVIWSMRAIELYATTAHLERSEGTRRNYRAMLLRISEVLLPDEHPDKPTALGLKVTVAPYSSAELQEFRRWATSQLTPLKESRAMLMLMFCAGAGVRTNELARLHPTHVRMNDIGVLVDVPGQRARTVPLLAEWEDWVQPVLDCRPPDELLWGPIARRDAHNLTSAFTQYSNGNPPRADRLRNTWFIHHIRVGTPMKDLFRAAGVTKLNHLPQLLEHVEVSGDERYQQLLRSAVKA